MRSRAPRRASLTPAGRRRAFAFSRSTQSRLPPMPAARVQHLGGVAITLVQVEVGDAEVHRMPQKAGIGAQVDDFDAAAHLLNRPAGAVLSRDLEGVVDNRVHGSQRSW